MGRGAQDLDDRMVQKTEKHEYTRSRLYLAALMILFALVMLLCANTILLSAPVKNGAVEKVPGQIREISNTSGYDALKAQYDDVSRQLESLKKELDTLKKENRELTNDNIALQNTLKMAASAGVKPQNYTRFKGLKARGDLDRGKYIGKFLITAYTPCSEECGNNEGYTNSGKPIVPGITVAVDNKYWPFGTVFYIKGLGYAVAMDTGNAIKGKNRFDFSVFDKKFAGKIGAGYWDVYLIKMGSGVVEGTGL